jgi:hypothetical protein
LEEGTLIAFLANYSLREGGVWPKLRFGFDDRQQVVPQPTNICGYGHFRSEIPIID